MAAGTDPTWRDTARAVRDFRQQHGVWPSQIGPTNAEAHLGRWLATQRGIARQGRLLADRREWIDARLPGWNEAGTKKDSWVRNARALGAWRDEHSRWPSSTARGLAERLSGMWLEGRREEARAGRLSGARRRLLDRVAACAASHGTGAVRAVGPRWPPSQRARHSRREL